jgi:hypothetical protein
MGDSTRSHAVTDITTSGAVIHALETRERPALALPKRGHVPCCTAPVESAQRRHPPAGQPRRACFWLMTCAAMRAIMIERAMVLEESDWVQKFGRRAPPCAARDSRRTARQHATPRGGRDYAVPRIGEDGLEYRSEAPRVLGISRGVPSCRMRKFNLQPAENAQQVVASPWQYNWLRKAGIYYGSQSRAHCGLAIRMCRQRPQNL